MGAGGSPRANTGPQSPHMGLWGAILGPGAAGAHPKGQGATGAYPGGRGLRGPILGPGAAEAHPGGWPRASGGLL